MTVGPTSGEPETYLAWMEKWASQVWIWSIPPEKMLDRPGPEMVFDASEVADIRNGIISRWGPLNSTQSDFAISDGSAYFDSRDVPLDIRFWGVWLQPLHAERLQVPARW